ncbi:hypothetical protein W03_11300 [Nitrosomonas sp. PY1]|uniref:PepSY domain-containing protein n=1 Tax=Nitrosomonas sp. PY1 TaxID=1803906 RepID=UPI001FC89288|nr:PepSY domain-containing protein [Nitrosomonas sp. PY1]GKS69126.1 hypothetical protein W03_11300 [Nitrosomonas sp. PY1]
MNRWQKIVTILIVLITPATQTIAQSNHAMRYYQAGSDHTIATTGITEQKAIAIAQQNFSGRVLTISHSQNTYRIKMLSRNGTVHIILINAADGAIISTH